MKIGGRYIMKKYASRGFIIFFVSSLVINLSIILLSNKDAEDLAADVFCRLVGITKGIIPFLKNINNQL